MKKKPILIQVAMEIECEKLLQKLENRKEKYLEGYKIYEGEIHNYPVIILLSKVGIIQTSISLTLATTKYNPIAILNFGIAGATSRDLHIKDIVIGESCVNINSYRTENRKETEGSNPNTWELLTFLSGEEDRFLEQKSDLILMELTKKISFPENNVYYGRIGSGDVWNREIDRILHLNQKYNILCEDMESIATYTIANLWNIPVISIKMISDNSILGEEYNREIGIYLQEYIFKYLVQLIESLNSNEVIL